MPAQRATGHAKSKGVSVGGRTKNTARVVLGEVSIRVRRVSDHRPRISGAVVTPTPPLVVAIEKSMPILHVLVEANVSRGGEVVTLGHIDAVAQAAGRGTHVKDLEPLAGTRVLALVVMGACHVAAAPPHLEVVETRPPPGEQLVGRLVVRDAGRDAVADVVGVAHGLRPKRRTKRGLVQHSVRLGESPPIVRLRDAVELGRVDRRSFMSNVQPQALLVKQTEPPSNRAPSVLLTIVLAAAVAPQAAHDVAVLRHELNELAQCGRCSSRSLVTREHGVAEAGVGVDEDDNVTSTAESRPPYVLHVGVHDLPGHGGVVVVARARTRDGDGGGGTQLAGWTAPDTRYAPTRPLRSKAVEVKAVSCALVKDAQERLGGDVTEPPMPKFKRGRVDAHGVAREHRPRQVVHAVTAVQQHLMVAPKHTSGAQGELKASTHQRELVERQDQVVLLAAGRGKPVALGYSDVEETLVRVHAAQPQRAVVNGRLHVPMAGLDAHVGGQHFVDGRGVAHDVGVRARVD